MLTTIKIQSQMDCNYICQRIQQAIVGYQKNNPDLTDTLLVIDIRKPYESNNQTLNLEFKNEST